MGKSVADFTEKKEAAHAAYQNATQVKRSLDAKKEAIDNAIAKLEEMLKLAKGDLQSTMQFLDKTKDELDDAKANVVSTKKDINHLLRDEAVLEEEKKEELSKSAEEVLSQGTGSTGNTGSTGASGVTGATGSTGATGATGL